MSGLGTDRVVVSSTSPATLTLDIQLDIDSRGVDSAFLSLEFDRDLLNELNVLSAQELDWTNAKGTRFLDQHLSRSATGSSQESSRFAQGELYTFDAVCGFACLDDGPKSTTLTFARVVFETNPRRVQEDGADVFSGFGPDGTGVDDGIFGNTPAFPIPNLTSSIVFRSAHVDVPEPGAPGLLVLGICALLVGRRGPQPRR